MMNYTLKVDRFWYIYFWIRFFYLLFAVLVYERVAGFGDANGYLNSGLFFSYKVFINSTDFMSCIGGLFGTFFGGMNVISNFPFMLYAFFIVRWTIKKLEFRKYVSSGLLLLLISFPNFCIWTSGCLKEIFGLTFSAIYAVLIINFLKGDYKIRWRDVLATYLCFLFKPQYFPFIFQGLLFIYIAGKWCHTCKSQLFWGFLILFCNLIFLYCINDIINQYAGMMYAHFDNAAATSTRENIFFKDNDFFREAPWGMFIAFFGPTLQEMGAKPLQLIAGLESLFIILSFIFLLGHFIARLLCLWKINITIFFSYFIIITGICFLHYPFGIFNPGSAIRYRTNFIFLFIVLFLYLYVYYRNIKQVDCYGHS